MSEEIETNPGTEATDQFEGTDTGVESAQEALPNEEDVEFEGIDGEAGDTPEGDEDPDVEEVEYSGKKYRVPKAFNAERMMQADYTKKTQEVAERRKALESRETEITQRAEFQKANLADFAKLHTIEADIKVLSGVTEDQWKAIKDKDPDEYRDLKDRFRDLKDERETLAGALSAKEQEANAAQERASTEETATLKRTMAAVLTGAEKHESGLDLTIPNLTPERLGKIGANAAQAYGFTSAELGQITDPRIIRALEDARVGRLAQAKAKAVARVEDSQKTTPAKAVGGAAPNARKTTDASGDGLSDEEWHRRENERLASKRRPNRR